MHPRLNKCSGSVIKVLSLLRERDLARSGMTADTEEHDVNNVELLMDI